MDNATTITSYTDINIQKGSYMLKINLQDCFSRFVIRLLRMNQLLVQKLEQIISAIKQRGLRTKLNQLQKEKTVPPKTAKKMAPTRKKKRRN